MQRIVIAGGSLGGLRTTEALYAAGFDGQVVVISEEKHRPYTRPPLSKLALAQAPDLSKLLFKQRPEAERADWRPGVSVVTADLEAHSVDLSDGSQLTFDALVAATGVRPKRLPTSITSRAHVIRTFDDCRALQPHMARAARVAIVGAGFIGCEVAATAARLGCSVDVVALDPVPLHQPLGLEVGAAVQRRHEREGVRFHLGTAIAAIADDKDTQTLELADGMTLTCDVLVVAIGSAPCVEWLEGNGLDLADGVACDNWMRMDERPAMVAVGDVARFPNPLFDDVPRRVEHWQMPMDTARRAAATVLSDLHGQPADPAPFTPLPTFWSDQYDLRLQSFGALSLADEVRILEGDLDDEAVAGYYRGGRLVGALLMGFPKKMVPVRRQVLAELTATG